MSIADELNHLAGDIGDAYDAVDDMGGVIPAAKNMDNLDTAIRTIPQPTVNDGTLTIQQNGTTVQTFTANQASNATANITVPVNTSDLNNDSGFITSSSLPTKTSDLTNDGSDGTSTYVEADELATVATSGSYNDLSNTPTIPTQTSDLTNDGSDGTSTYVEADELATVATTGAYSDLSGTPTIPTATSDLTNDSGFITSADLPTKTSDLTNDGSDGTSTYVEASDLATVATSGSYTDLINTPTIPAAQVNSDWNASSGVAEILNKPTLATVATSGSYTDLSNTPTIPTATSDLTNDSGFITSASLPGDMTGATSQDAGTHGLVPAPAAGDEGKFLQGNGTWATVSTGTQYTAGNGISIDANNEISIDTTVVAEVSDIPTQTSDLTNNGSDGTSTYVEADELATVATSGSYTDLSNTPTIPAAQVNSDWNAVSGVAQILNKPNLATVATSGSYTDLTNTPSIPAAQVNSDWNASSGVAEILNKPSLAAVATSGAYSDLTGTPTIPTVNDATLTITQNGTSAGTFTANASSNATIALTDTTYSAFTGTDGQTAGTAGLVPAPATTDAGKFLKADGTWDTAGSSAITVYSDWDGFSSYSGVTVNLYDGANTSTANVISGASFHTLVTSGSRVEIRPVTSINKDYVYVVTSNTLVYSPDQYAATIEGSGYAPGDGGIVGNLVYINNVYTNLYAVFWKQIPTVYNATLTVQHNGTTAGTFSANASAAKTINIETIYADDYISTSPIPTTVTTAMIEDGAVTAAKLDWSSVGGALMYVARFPIHRQTYNNSTLVFDAPSVSVQVDANISVSRVSSNSHLQLDLPTTGVYAANVSTQLWTGQNSWDYMLLELRKNNTGFTRVMAPKIGGSWGFCATQGWASVANGDYISEYLNTGGNNFSDGNISAKDSFVEIVIYRVG